MLGVTIQPLAVRDLGELEGAFAAATKEKASALLVFREQIFGVHRQQIVNFVTTHRLPAIYGAPPFVEVGGLIVYAANFVDMIRRTGGFVDKILKGANPATLPIEQPTKFELVINLKTARALGLTIPQTLLLRADQVIE
jgi:putative tryptophan/tyrosine transport system substrate-binding protein